jgi:hypothetical protein
LTSRGTCQPQHHLKPAAMMPRENSSRLCGYSHGDTSNQHGEQTGDLTILEGTLTKGSYPIICPGYDSSDFARGWDSNRLTP